MRRKQVKKTVSMKQWHQRERERESNIVPYEETFHCEGRVYLNESACSEGHSNITSE